MYMDAIDKAKQHGYKAINFYDYAPTGSWIKGPHWSIRSPVGECCAHGFTEYQAWCRFFGWRYAQTDDPHYVEPAD